MEKTNYINQEYNFNKLWFIPISLFVFIISYVFSALEISYIFPALPIAIALLYFSYKNLEVWIITTFLILPGILLLKDAEMSAIEYFLYFYILGGTMLCFYKYNLLQRKRLINNLGELFLILFILFAFTNIIIAILNNVTFADWIRGYLLFYLYLMYFPFKEYLKDKKKLDIFIFFFIICSLMICTYSVINLRTTMVEAIYSYQMTRGPRDNISIIAFSIFVSIIFFFITKSKIYKLLLIINFLLASGLVIASFARATWLTVILLFCINVLILKRSQKIKLFIIALFTSLALFISLTSVVKNYDPYFKLINKKFLSSKDGKKDISVRARLYEYQGVFKQVEQYPVSGSGISKKYSYKDILISSITKSKIFTHNSYLHFWYMLGIPTSICFFIFIILFLYRSIYILFSKSKYNLLQRNLAFLCLCGLSIATLHSFASPHFSVTETIIMISISVALINKDLLGSIESNDNLNT